MGDLFGLIVGLLCLLVYGLRLGAPYVVFRALESIAPDIELGCVLKTVSTKPQCFFNVKSKCGLMLHGFDIESGSGP